MGRSDARVNVAMEPAAGAGGAEILVHVNTEREELVTVIVPSPVPRSFSYAMSGTPHPSPHAALEGSSRMTFRGPGTASIRAPYPGAFYSYDFKVVPPSVIIRTGEKQSSRNKEQHNRHLERGQALAEITVPVPAGSVPAHHTPMLRTLIPRPERAAKGPGFYQERIERTGVASAWDMNVTLARDIKIRHGTG